MNGIVLLDESMDMLMKLSDEDGGQLMKALVRHIRGEEPGELNAIVDIVFPFVCGQVDRMIEIREKRVASGSKGGIAKANAKQNDSKPLAKDSKPLANAKQTDGKPLAKVYPNTNTNTNTNTNDSIRRFTPPTVQDVFDYAFEKGLDIDAERFVDFYASKGWKVGSSPMKDWRAAARNWARDGDHKKKSEAPVFNFDQRKTDYDALLSSMGL